MSSWCLTYLVKFRQVSRNVCVCVGEWVCVRDREKSARVRKGMRMREKERKKETECDKKRLRKGKNVLERKREYGCLLDVCEKEIGCV